MAHNYIGVSMCTMIADLNGANFLKHALVYRCLSCRLLVSKVRGAFLEDTQNRYCMCVKKTMTAFVSVLFYPFRMYYLGV